MRTTTLVCAFGLHGTLATLQKPQSPIREGSPARYAALEIINYEHLGLTTHMSVGNPPQNFTALIDTGFSGMMIPSANCTQPEYCDSHPLYNSTCSSTYLPDGKSVFSWAGIFWTSGVTSIDSLNLGGVKVESQPFEEATVYQPSYLIPDDWHDATLTLSRVIICDNQDTNMSEPSPFMTMVDQGLLERNEFSLKIPREIGGTGVLLLGSRGDEYNASSAVKIPLRPRESYADNEISYYWSGGWEVEPLYFKFGSGDDSIYYDLTDHVASFRTFGSWLDVPKSFAAAVVDRVGANPFHSSLPCSDVDSSFPNLTIAFRGMGGRVEELVMTAEDLVMDLPWMPKDPGECHIILARHEETDDVPKYIALGTPFLRGYYSIFDEDSKSVILTPLQSTEH